MAGPQILLALQSPPAATGIPIVLVETGAVVVLGGATPIPASDALAVGLVDVASSLVASLTASDQFAPALADTGSVVVAVASSDLVAVALADAGAVAIESLVLVAASDDAGIFLLDLGLVVPLVMVVGLDEAALALDDAGASVAVSLDPGPASIPSWSAGFRRGWLPGPYPEVPAPIVAKVAGDAVACAVAEFDEPGIVNPNGGFASSRKAIERDDEEVLLLI